MSETFDEAYWDDRYSAGRQWSGNPNATLVSVVEALTPGTALDVGAGEGGDAIWLARRGWSVTALDISRNALRLAAAHAEEVAPEEVAPEAVARISWVHRDLSVAGPALGSFDLVTAHYIHLPPMQREVFLRAMAAAVAPGGTLLVVAHHPSDVETVPRPPTPELFYLGSDVLADIGAGWEIVRNEARPRTVTHPEHGHEVTIHDMIVVARRPAG